MKYNHLGKNFKNFRLYQEITVGLNKLQKSSKRNSLSKMFNDDCSVGAYDTDIIIMWVETMLRHPYSEDSRTCGMVI